jgi:hypothetical protein
VEPDEGGADGEDAGEEGAGVGTEELVGVEESDGVGEAGGEPWLLPLPVPFPEGTPGDETWSTSCVPSAIGPAG